MSMPNCRNYLNFVSDAYLRSGTSRSHVMAATSLKLVRMFIHISDVSCPRPLISIRCHSGPFLILRGPPALPLLFFVRSVWCLSPRHRFFLGAALSLSRRLHSIIDFVMRDSSLCWLQPSSLTIGFSLARDHLYHWSDCR